MSGGSFEYLYYRIEDIQEQVQTTQERMETMAAFLEQENRPEIAKVIRDYAQTFATQPNKDLIELIRAVEWHASGDYGNETMDRYWNTYQNKHKTLPI